MPTKASKTDKADKAPATGNYPIPFDKQTGEMLHYAWAWHNGVDTLEWRDNYEFTATLKWDGFQRGRSAAYLQWVDAEGTHYSMFLQQFDEVMRAACLHDDRARGVWTFCKRGENYGVRLVRALVAEDAGLVAFPPAPPAHTSSYHDDGHDLEGDDFPPIEHVSAQQWGSICQVLSDFATEYCRATYSGGTYDELAAQAHDLAQGLSIPYGSTDEDNEEE